MDLYHFISNKARIMGPGKPSGMSCGGVLGTSCLHAAAANTAVFFPDPWRTRPWQRESHTALKVDLL